MSLLTPTPLGPRSMRCCRVAEVKPSARRALIVVLVFLDMTLIPSKSMMADARTTECVAVVEPGIHDAKPKNLRVLKNYNKFTNRFKS